MNNPIESLVLESQEVTLEVQEHHKVDESNKGKTLHTLTNKLMQGGSLQEIKRQQDYMKHLSLLIKFPVNMRC